MYVIYNKDKGFLYDDEDAICGWGYDYVLNDYTVTFYNLDDAIFNCEMGEVVLKVEHHKLNK